MRRFLTHQQRSYRTENSQKPSRSQSWLLSLSKKNKGHNYIRRAGVFFLLAAVIASTILTPFNASAVTTASSKTNDPSWLAKSYWYYNAVSQCMGSVGSWNVSGDGSDIKAGKWFYSGFVIGSVGDGPGGFIMRGVLNDIGDDGLMNCAANDNELLRGALDFWGISGTELACGTLFKRENNTDCLAGNGGFTWKSTGSDNKAPFQNYIKQKVYDGSTPALGNVASFIYYRDTFLNGCAYKAQPLTTKPSGSQVYTIANPKDDASTPPVYYIGDQKGSTDRWTTTNPNATKTCDQLAKLVAPDSTYATKYAEWLKKNKDNGTPVTTTCPDGSTANSGEVCGGTTNNGKSSCVVEGVGWIICPITNFLAGVADASYGLIKNFLVVNVKLFDTTSGTYAAWAAFRNIANVAFVIVFLVIIFSQLTGQGVSNYGIKKTLPRLVVAAVLVNASYYVCQFAVDATQILGASIRDVLKVVPIGSGDTTTPSWTTVMGDILMGSGIALAAIGGIAASVAIVGLSVSLPVLLAALLAVLMTVIILVGRQAGIVILIVLSPLAFVAYMLPNTEQWFKRWYKVFLALLMVFPIVSLLYGGGELTSKIISSAANSSDTDASMKFWMSITAIAVAAIPLIMTPSILKGSLNGLGSIGTKLSGLASKANSNVRKTANTSSRYGEAKQGLKNRFALSRADRRVNSRAQQAFDQSGVGRFLGTDKGSTRARAAVQKEEIEEHQQAKSVIQFDNLDGASRQELAMTGQTTYKGKTYKGDAFQRAAIEIQMGGAGSLGNVHEIAKASSSSLSKFGSTISQGALSSTSKDPALSGKSIDELSQGTFNYDTAVQRAIGEGKYSAEAFAGMHDDARKAAIGVARAQEAAGNPSLIQALRGAATGIQSSHELSGKIAGNPIAQSQISELLGGATGGTAAAATVSADGGLSISHESGSTAAAPTAPLDPYDARNAQRQAEVQANVASAETPQEWQDWQAQERARQAAAQPGTPAGQAQTTQNAQGQMGVVGQHEDTIDRMSR